MRELPPLSRKVLTAVEDTERYARQSLSECEGDDAEYFNTPKAFRALNTCAVEVFDLAGC